MTRRTHDQLWQQCFYTAEFIQKDQPTALLSDWKHRNAALIQKAVKLRLFKTWISNNMIRLLYYLSKIFSRAHIVCTNPQIVQLLSPSCAHAPPPPPSVCSAFWWLIYYAIYLNKNKKVKSRKKISGINFGQVKGKRNATLKYRYSSASHSKFAIFTFLCTAARGLSVLCDEALWFCLLKHDTFIVS